MAYAHSEIGYHATLARLAPRVHVATLSGELDLYAEPELRRMLRPLGEADGTVVIADLIDVAFIDSTALGVLTGLARTLRRRAGELVVVTGDPRVRRLLEITGLLRVLTHESSLARAVERSVGSPAL